MSLRIRQGALEDNSFYDKLDDLVNNTKICQVGLAEDSPSLAWGALLSSIVKFSNGRLDPQYRDHSTAIDLLHDSPSLLDVLKEAWRKKSYRKIVKMGESPLSSTFFSAAHGCNRNAPVTKFIKIRERYTVLQLGVDCLKQ
ncbi:hypothetical protein SCLCIDRAFT_27790 [Scleroderma citrinum Foug A]|uniref:Uncharacterized protein n=1 Tax=Scleroderma citrinum Foug A TaxID=1036808 RepID=A0A0C3DS21_9AGAM|nr:hypothetical protein SCLCIDRAFT_27790 [Scleroderma citrinum Foug A]